MCLLLICGANSFAQREVTKFLGIPVDGYRSEMRKKLIEKGFTPKNLGREEYFEGEFNGMDVEVFIVTNNNKVYRIMVRDKYKCGESQIKTRFNRLVSQFEKNKRYSHFEDNQSLADDEDISYEMMVHKKEYQASFYQNPEDEDKFNQFVTERGMLLAEDIKGKYSEEELSNPTEEMQKEMYSYALDKAYDLFMEYLAKKSVWFRIGEDYGRYYIIMYYDNAYNQADGEDL